MLKYRKGKMKNFMELLHILREKSFESLETHSFTVLHIFNKDYPANWSF